MVWALSRVLRLMSVNDLQPLQPSVTMDLSVPSNNYNMGKYSVAVSGDVFRWIVDFANEEMLKKVCVVLPRRCTFSFC